MFPGEIGSLQPETRTQLPGRLEARRRRSTRRHDASIKHNRAPPFGMALRALMARFKMAAVNKVARHATHRGRSRDFLPALTAMALSRVQVSILGIGAAVLL